MNNQIELQARLQALRSKQKRVGPYRAAGIQRSIDSIKAALRVGEEGQPIDDPVNRK